MPAFKIAVIGGDGIGPEVIDQAVRVLEVVTKKANASFTWNKLPWSAINYEKTGVMVPDDGWE